MPASDLTLEPPRVTDQPPGAAGRPSVRAAPGQRLGVHQRGRAGAGPGSFVVETSHLSIDPAMRGWMNAGPSYVPPVEVGEVMRAGAVGRVTASEHPGFAEGDYVYGAFGVQEYALSDGQGVSVIDTSLAEPSTYLGALGMTGLTAYFGLLDIGRIQPGETVVVSGAAGAVGSIAGQIAKIKGCRAVGIAGRQAKCRAVVDEFRASFKIGVTKFFSQGSFLGSNLNDDQHPRE